MYIYFSSFDFGFIHIVVYPGQSFLGVFGMVPAMYVDVSPTFKHCVWTPTMDLSNFQIYSMELVIRPLTPYLIPALLLAYPLFKVTTTYRCMDEGKAKPIVFTILTITWSYFIMNLPYALVLVRETSSQILGVRKKGFDNSEILAI